MTQQCQHVTCAFAVAQRCHHERFVASHAMNKVNPEAWLAWVLERIQDHPANRINDLMLWAYQDMIDAKNAEAGAKDAA